jgi:hypothetical protein
MLGLILLRKQGVTGAANGEALGGSCWDGPAGILDSTGQWRAGLLGEKVAQPLTGGSPWLLVWV